MPAGVVVSDAIPANTTGSESEANCAIAAGVFTCTTTAALAPSASVSFQLTLAVDPDYPRRPRSPTPPRSRPRRSPIRCPATTRPPTPTRSATSADLAITKTDGVASVIAGTSTTYTITVTNNGPSTVPAGVVISDPIPAGTTGSELRGRLRDLGGGLRLHHHRGSGALGLGVLPAHPDAAGELRAADPCQHRHDHVLAHRPIRCPATTRPPTPTPSRPRRTFRSPRPTPPTRSTPATRSSTRSPW